MDHLIWAVFPGALSAFEVQLTYAPSLFCSLNIVLPSIYRKQERKKNSVGEMGKKERQPCARQMEAKWALSHNSTGNKSRLKLQLSNLVLLMFIDVKTADMLISTILFGQRGGKCPLIWLSIWLNC